ncbi:unnamed protein product, partial [Ixodes pacificus]
MSQSLYLLFITCISITSSSRHYQRHHWERASRHQAPVTLRLGVFDFPGKRRQESSDPLFRGSDATTGIRSGDIGQRVGPLVQQPPQIQFDMLRNILHKANRLEDLMRDDSSRFLGNGIALSRDAVRVVFGNRTSPNVRGPGVSRMRVHPGKLFNLPRKVALHRRPSTKHTRSIPTLRSVTTPTTTTTPSTTTKASIPLSTKRRKLFVRLRRTNPVKPDNGIEANTFRKSYIKRSDERSKRVVPLKVETPFINYDGFGRRSVGGAEKYSHLSNPEGLMKRRFETFKDLEVQIIRGGSTLFQMPDVEVVYKKAIIYKTATENSSVEMFCFAGYHKAASITWHVNERPPDESITIETAYTKRAHLNIVVSRLRVSRLDVLPSRTGKYTFQCAVNVDDSDAQSRIEVKTAFNNSCIDNTDCDARNALCTFGKCECKDFLPVPLRSKHTTCRSFGYIGWPCNYDEQCSYAVQNSLCDSRRKCGCQQYYRPSSDNQSCLAKNGLGAACSSQSDCDIFRAKCRSGHCRCPEGTASGARMCVSVPSSTLLERMKNKMFKSGNASDVLSAENSSATGLPGSDKRKFNGAAITALSFWRVWLV